MKLLMTTDTIGGVWTYAIELARALADEGVAVTLACTGNPLSPDQWTQLCELPNTTAFARSCSLEWMDDPWADVEATGQWLLALRDHVQPDAVHLNEFAHGSLDWHVPTVLVGHSCVLSWWQAVKGCDAPARFERYSRTVRTSLQRVNAVAAPSRDMAHTLDRLYEPAHPVEVIANGRSRRAADGLKQPMVFAAGRLWDEAKNLAALDRAARHLQWPVYLAGPTIRFGSPHPMTAANAHLLGPVPARTVLAWMSRAAIYALPAWYEPFGLSVLEAAQCGCCLVLGDIASLRENWDGAAVFVDPDDPLALHAKLCQLIADPAQRRQLSEAAFDRSCAFTPQRMARQYAQLYQRVLSTASVAAT